jgi:hypothetical protein
LTENRRRIGRPFKKGQGGRPKGAKNKATVERELLARAAAFVDGDEYFENVRQRILRGRAPHAESYLLRRLKGDSTQHVEMSGPNKKPIKVVIQVVRG